jgi:hypothetical protein
MDNKILENILYKILKIIIMFYLYIKNNYNYKYTVKNDKRYKVTHSCVVSNKGEYIKDITDLVKMHKVCPKTNIEFFKSLIKDTNVVVHLYLEKEGEDIEIKYVL